ncbi:hypothetical protein QTP88_016731 [Uroleucon formosanum]
MLMTKILMTLPENYKHFYGAWDSIPNVDKTLSNLSSRLMVEETRQTQGYDAQKDTASSSAFSEKKLYEKNKEKHTKIGNSENQRNNDKKPGKCVNDHMTSRREWFNNYESFKVQLPVRIGDGKYITPLASVYLCTSTIFSIG